MKKVLGLTVVALALLALGAPAGASAQALPALECNAASQGPCVKYCRIEEAGRYPCGVENRKANLTGRYTYSVAMNTATQNATGVAGDPGGSGTANITLDLTNNRFCATTTWSGI